MRSVMPLFAVFSSVLALGLCGCSKSANKQNGPLSANPTDPPQKYVVAMVNATPLTWGEMNKRAMGYLKDDIDTNHLIIPSNRLEEAKEYFRRRSINAFVFKTILMDEAVKKNIRLTEADRQAGLKGLENTLKARNWTTNDFFLKGPMNETTMRREFEDGLLIDKQLKLAVQGSLKIDNKEIVQAIELIGATNDLKRAKLETVRKQLLAGANFEDVAQNVSECTSAKNGGDLGELVRGKMPKPFEDVAFTQKVGALSSIVETQFGYHIIKVTARNPAQKATATTPGIPESVHVSHILIKRIPVDRKRISESILRIKYNVAVQKYYGELKATSKISCYLYKDMAF